MCNSKKQHMKKLLLLAPLALLFSCGNEQKEEYKMSKEDQAYMDELQKQDRIKDSMENLPPQVLSFEDALNDSSANKHSVVIEGYLELPGIISISDKQQSMNFYGRKNQNLGDYIYINMPLGSGNNSMKKLPEKYTVENVSIKDNSGQPVGLNERVKLTGTMYASESIMEKGKYTQYFTVNKIEKAEEKEFDYDAANWPVLTRAIADKADDNKGKAFYAEGVLEVPMFLFIGNDMSIELKTPKGETLNVKVLTGAGSSMMEALKENWTPKDIKIRNNKGELINLKKKVKVYGVLSYDGLHAEAIIQ